MQTKIIAVSGGFYFFGTEITAPEGYISLKNAAMFGGIAGVAAAPLGGWAMGVVAAGGVHSARRPIA